MGKLFSIAALICALVPLVYAQEDQGSGRWFVHDRERPIPPVVTPAAEPGGIPSDAKSLFNGQSLDAFQSVNGGGPAPWKIADGTFTVTPGSGSIQTKVSYGDCQLHVEWASPNPPNGEDQMRGNSGLIMMGMFEIQVLDSFDARTYADGQAGAIYGQYPPLANSSRGPGQWQTYDILFRGPRFDSAGQLTRRTRVTLIHNGVVVQEATELTGPTAYHNRPPYFQIPERGPIVIQEHGTTVRYRNIWIRDLPEEPELLPARSVVALHPDPTRFAAYAGAYEGANLKLSVAFTGDRVTAQMAAANPRGGMRPGSLTLIPTGDDAFLAHSAPGADAFQILFSRDGKGQVASAVAFVGGRYVTFNKLNESSPQQNH